MEEARVRPLRAATAFAALTLACGLSAQAPPSGTKSAPPKAAPKKSREAEDPKIRWWGFQGVLPSPQPCAVIRTRDDLEEYITRLGWSNLQGHPGIAWQDGKFAAVLTGPPQTQLGQPLRVEAVDNMARIHLSAERIMHTRIFVVELGPTPIFKTCETAAP